MASSDEEPQLPEDTTAEELINDYSQSARAAIAEAQGLTLVAFDSYLNARIRRERVAASISKAVEVLKKTATEEPVRDKNAIAAEEAVIQGMKNVVKIFGPESLTDEEIEALERNAYTELEEIAEKEPLWFMYGTYRNKFEHMFRRIEEARVQNEIRRLTNSGVEEENARKSVIASMLARSVGTNLNVLKSVLSTLSKKLEKDQGFWWSGRETRKLSELEDIIAAYGKRALMPQESELLAAFVKASKANYFTNISPPIPILHKYRKMLDTIFSAYRNYGPHKRKVDNVSGPAEVFTSHPSDRVAGYRRTSKARPHRDPSDGSGENW